MQDQHKTKAQLIDELESLRSELHKLGTTQQELLEARDFLENVIASSLDGVVVSDNHGCITKANKAFLSLIGYTADEVAGEMMPAFTPTEAGVYECCTGESVEIDKRFFDDTTTMVTRFMQDGKISNWRTYLLGRNRKLIPVDINIAILCRGKERIGSVGILRDVSERTIIEREIRKGKDFLANVIENSMDGIAVVDETGVIISVNSALAKMSGRGQASLIGEHISILTVEDEDTRSSIRKKTEELFEKGYASYESKHKIGTGQLIDVECNTSLVKDAKGNTIAGIAIIRNITARKKTEEALLETEERFRNVVDNIVATEHLTIPREKNRARIARPFRPCGTGRFMNQ